MSLFPPNQPWQREILSATERFLVGAGGRGSGKSNLAQLYALKRGTGPGVRDRRVMWFHTTYTLAKSEVYEPLRDLLKESRALRDKSDSDLVLKLVNGTRYDFKGSDRLGTLRGPHPDTVVVDEMASQKRELWTKVIRPMLGPSMGCALIISSPEGFDHFHDVFLKGWPGEAKQAHWRSWKFRTADAPHIDPTEIEEAKKDLDEDEFRQEYEADFVAPGGAIFRQFDRSVHVKPTPYLPNLPVYAGQDFNIGCMPTVLFQEVEVPGRPHPLVRVFAELVSHDRPTYEHAARLREFIAEPPYRRRPEHVDIHCDATGSARQRAGESDVYALRALGFRVLHPSANPPEKDRLSATRRMLRSADGVVSMQIDPSCKLTVDSLEKFRRKPGTTESDKTQGWDHACEALGYAIHWRHPMRSPARAHVQARA